MFAGRYYLLHLPTLLLIRSDPRKLQSLAMRTSRFSSDSSQRILMVCVNCPVHTPVDQCSIAQALASDVRYCSVTNARLPKFFLQDFELLEHPEDGSPHYVPRSLTKGAKPGVLNAPPTFPTKEEKAEPQETISRKGYVLARRIMIEFMTSTGRGTKPWFSWAFDLSRWISLQKLKMRYDMHDLVLSLMRKRIVEEIIWMYAMRHRGVIYMTPCKNEDWVEEVRSKKTQLGAVLWLGKNGDVEGSTSNVPGDFATLDMDKVGGTKLPVHNLVRLLGPENISYLREKAPTLFGKATAVTLKYKTTTSGLLSKLWKLEGYTALEAEYQAYKIAEEEEEK